MARLFAATDFLTIPQGINTGGCLSFWMRTTQTTPIVELVGHHTSSGSQNGYGVLINNTGSAGKLTAYGKQSNLQRVSLTSTTTVNDGQWHHVFFNFWYAALANGNQMWIDGNLEAQTNAGGAWGGASDPFRLGKSNDTFWAGYVGELAEVAVWAGGGTSLVFPPEQIQSLAKGYVPDKVWRGGPAGAFHIYLPLTRSVQCKLSEVGTPTVSGTSVSDHPRMIGASGP